LKIRGYAHIEESSHTINDPIFLESLMEIQEKIEEANLKEDLVELKKRNFTKYFNSQ
jgi:hypothetical protein